MKTSNEKLKQTFRSLLSMNAIFTIISICLISGLPIENISAQEAVKVDTVKFNEAVFHIDSVDVKPEYPGGEMGSLKFLAKNIKYPVNLMKENVQGKVICGFIINKKGEVIDPFIMQGAHPGLDNEALRVIRLMKNWKPGMHNGDTVNVITTLPINFRLNQTTKYYKSSPRGSYSR